jgi:D-sedoheptulose 7-phosphate isomerase
MNLNEYKNCLNSIDESKLKVLKELVHSHTQIIILGNGGSNAISLHIAEDYHKMLGIKSIAFGDSARMSCYANDYGWDNAYKMFLEHFVEERTLVILISSSGNSENILNCAEYCVKNVIPMITLSGHSEQNLLKYHYENASKLHFWINSTDYGIVEGLHELILHSII